MTDRANPLWEYFHKGLKQNAVHYRSYCKACVTHHEKIITAAAAASWENLVAENDASSALHAKEKLFADACGAAGSTRGERTAQTAHILGSRGIPACPHVSETVRDAVKQIKESHESGNASGNASSSSGTKRVRTESSNQEGDPSAKKKQKKLQVFSGVNMPFSNEQAEALRAQAARAIISTNSPFCLFEDPEMIRLFRMIRTTVPEILPSRKVVGGRLLNEAAEAVENKLARKIQGQSIGLSTDAWKSLTKDSVNALCANVNFEVYELELIETTAANKDGPSQCQQFEEMIDRVEKKYSCIVIYFATDADGGSKKGRRILGKRRPWLLVPSCWAHQFQLILGDYFRIYPYAAEIAEKATILIGWLNNHGKVRAIFNKSPPVGGDHVSISA